MLVVKLANNPFTVPWHLPECEILSIASVYLHFWASIVILSINSRSMDLDIEPGVFICGVYVQ